MKKTRYQEFMAATTATAMDLVELETFEDHLNYTILSIQMELLKAGKKEKPKRKRTRKKVRSQSRVDQISGALGTIKRGLIWSWSGLKKIYNYLITGNNFMIAFISVIILYVIVITVLEMI